MNKNICTYGMVLDDGISPIQCFCSSESSHKHCSLKPKNGKCKIECLKVCTWFYYDKQSNCPNFAK